MSDISRVSLFGKLNSMVYKALESAVVFCKQRGNPEVQLAHWLREIVIAPGNDIELILRHHRMDAKAITSDLTAALDRLPRGSDNVKGFGPHVDDATERAWVYATLAFHASSIRSGHLLVALLKTSRLHAALGAVSPTLATLSADRLVDEFTSSTDGSAEAELMAQDGSSIGRRTERAQRDIFISYRRAESAHLPGRIFDHLERAFGPDRVFKDVEAIPIGARDFAEVIRNQLKASRLMIAMIGPDWLTMRDQNGRRRLDDEEDFVRIEIGWALEHRLPVVPLLFDGATFPVADELPSVLRPLARCQSMPVRVDPDFRNDMKRLVDACRHHLEAPAASAARGN